MTTNQIKSGGGEAIYVICKYGGYYRPNAAGYTNDVTQAGRYTLAEAISHSHPNGPDGPRDGITYHLAPEVSAPAKAGEDGVGRAHAAFVLAAAKIERGTRLDSLTMDEEKALVKAVLSSIEDPRR